MRIDLLIRSMETIKALQTYRNGITAQQLAKRLETHTRTAYRYIDAASIVFPVIESKDSGRAIKFRIERREKERGASG